MYTRKCYDVTKLTIRTLFTLLFIMLMQFAIGTIYAQGTKGNDGVMFTDISDNTSDNKRYTDKCMCSHMYVDVVKRITPAVVNIATQKISTKSEYNDRFIEFLKEFFHKDMDSIQNNVSEGVLVNHSLGSGFIVDPNGYIITNRHVINDADGIEVSIGDGGKRYKAKVIGQDAITDIAILKIEPDSLLPYLTIGDSNKIHVGEQVIAVGNPMGLGCAVTTGVVSAKDRSLFGAGDFIQTDASINVGNSGGPLCNMNGEVIGINSAIISSSGGSIGINFARPISTLTSIYQQLKDKGIVTRGFLGVSITSVNMEVAESIGMKEVIGAYVVSTTPGAPAEKAGIKQGDIILKFDDRPILRAAQLYQFVAQTPVNKSVVIEILRNENGKNVTKNVKLKIGERNDGESNDENNNVSKSDKAPHDILGIMVNDITPNLQKRFNSNKIDGVIVESVKKTSQAALRGIRPGNVIKRINQTDVKSVADFERAFKDAQKDKKRTIALLVANESGTVLITLDIDGGGVAKTSTLLKGSDSKMKNKISENDK